MSSSQLRRDETIFWRLWCSKTKTSRDVVGEVCLPPLPSPSEAALQSGFPSTTLWWWGTEVMGGRDKLVTSRRLSKVPSVLILFCLSFFPLPLRQDILSWLAVYLLNLGIPGVGLHTQFEYLFCINCLTDHERAWRGSTKLWTKPRKVKCTSGGQGWGQGSPGSCRESVPQTADWFGFLFPAISLNLSFLPERVSHRGSSRGAQLLV